MTCTFAIFDGNTIVMSSDSAGTSDDGTIDSQKNSKMFILTLKKSGQLLQVLVGFAGCFRAAQILKHGLSLPEWTHGTQESYMVSHFVPEAIKVLYKNEIGHKDSPFGACSLLVAFDGHLFTVEPNGQVLESNMRFCAIGSGAEVALGAAHALMEYEEPSWVIAEKALYAAEAFKSTVRRPFHIEYIMITS
jgi:ATP-dependent protease HslVU (ClpYQ) peptidase subunit